MPTAAVHQFATDEGQRQLDKMLANELNQMSIQQREKVYEEIHGVNRVLEESPSLLNEGLFRLDQVLQGIYPKPAYDQAFRQNASYCLNPKLRLAFLRAEYFDASRAAVRMVKFFEGKLEYFGPDALGRDLRLNEDMDEDDRKCLQAGHLQILPARDRAGRAVFCDFQATFPTCYKQARNMVSNTLHT